MHLLILLISFHISWITCGFPLNHKIYILWYLTWSPIQGPHHNTPCLLLWTLRSRWQADLMHEVESTILNPLVMLIGPCNHVSYTIHAPTFVLFATSFLFTLFFLVYLSGPLAQFLLFLYHSHIKLAPLPIICFILFFN